MEFQKIANFLGTTLDDKDFPRFVTKKWIEVNDQTGKNNYNVYKESRNKTSMLNQIYVIILMRILLWKEIFLLQNQIMQK